MLYKGVTEEKEGNQFLFDSLKPQEHKERNSPQSLLYERNREGPGRWRDALWG